MKKIIATPISKEDLKDIRFGDVVYLNGYIVTCRDVAHRRLVECGRELPVNVRDGAILHAGPITREISCSPGKYEMISIGPTTSMRMEMFEKEFIKKTGVRIIVGKGGMGKETEEGCREYGTIHCIFPAGNAVIAAVQVEEIEKVHWLDLGMPEALWVCRIHEFGPLIVSIDIHGNNICEQNKCVFNERKDEALEKIYNKVRFIK